MFPKRKIDRKTAGSSYGDGMNFLNLIMHQPKPSDMKNLALALDSHFNAVGAMLSELADSIDMLFERIDNLERRIR